MAQREQWGTRAGFIMAAMGSAVGLGNIWKFPYMCYANGGGAFLVPYVAALFVVGVPLMMLEFGLGHWARSGAPAALGKVHRRFSWVGWWAVSFVMFGIVIYYAVVIAWCGCYFVASFTKAWGQDPNAFFSKFILTQTTIYQEAVYSEAGELVTPGRFTFGALNGWIVLSLAVVWLLNWIITFFGIKRGIERASRIFMPLLLFLVGVLVVWSLASLEGAMDGVRFYLKPDWKVLWQPKVWTDAFTQIFFTLSLGFGIMIAYASYLPRESDIPMDAFITSVANCLFSFFAGFAVFATIGYLAFDKGVAVGDLEQVYKLSGPKLIFVTYPVMLNKMGAGGAVFGVLFLLLLVVAGLSSSISIVEAFATAVLDHAKVSRRCVVSVLCAIAFAIGLLFCTGSGLISLDIVDHFMLTYGLLVVAILECIIVGWFLTAKKLRRHLDDTAGMRFGPVASIVMRAVITVVLAVTWYGLATQGQETIGAGVVRFALVAGVLLAWLDEHWLDIDIKMVVPGLLVMLLDHALLADISKPYEGYPRAAVLWLGLGWLVATLVIAFVLNALFSGRGPVEPQAPPQRPSGEPRPDEALDSVLLAGGGRGEASAAGQE